MAGGNYSGTGKLSSAAPKQVIVNISNLLSVKTIDLLKSPDGQLAEIQNLKEQLAEALIDVVHDFDATLEFLTFNEVNMSRLLNLGVSNLLSGGIIQPWYSRPLCK